MLEKFKNIIFYTLETVSIVTLLNSCKTKKQEITPIITIQLNVKDDQKKSINNGTAYLYYSKDSYEVARENALKGVYNNVGSSKSKKVINGKVSFDSVPSNHDFWLLVVDTNSFFLNKRTGVSTNFRIIKDNTKADYYIDGYKGQTEVFADVIVEPTNALVKFDLTTTAGIKQFEISSLNQQTSSISEYVSVKKGKVSYYIRTNLCVWNNTVNVGGGEIYEETLKGCPNVGYVFKADKGNFVNGGEIEVFLGQNATNPVLTIKSEKQDTLYLPGENSYTFFAKHSKSLCVWENNLLPFNVLNVCN